MGSPVDTSGDNQNSVRLSLIIVFSDRMIIFSTLEKMSFTHGPVIEAFL